MFILSINKIQNKYHLNNNIVPLSQSIGMGRWDNYFQINLCSLDLETSKPFSFKIV